MTDNYGHADIYRGRIDGDRLVFESMDGRHPQRNRDPRARMVQGRGQVPRRTSRRASLGPQLGSGPVRAGLPADTERRLLRAHHGEHPVRRRTRPRQSLAAGRAPAAAPIALPWRGCFLAPPPTLAARRSVVGIASCAIRGSSKCRPGSWPAPVFAAVVGLPSVRPERATSVRGRRRGQSGRSGRLPRLGHRNCAPDRYHGPVRCRRGRPRDGGGISRTDRGSAVHAGTIRGPLGQRRVWSQTSMPGVLSPASGRSALTPPAVSDSSGDG